VAQVIECLTSKSEAHQNKKQKEEYKLADHKNLTNAVHFHQNILRIESFLFIQASKQEKNAGRKKIILF
jgi:hypothetical protein